MNNLRLIVSLMLLVVVPGGVAHDVPPRPAVVPLADMMSGSGWNLKDSDVTVQEIAEGFYVLFGFGGNIVVSSGEDGVLIVDDQLPEMWPKLKKAMRKMGDSDIDFVVNTHWHFDHAQGNLALGKRDTTWLVSQANSRRMLRQDRVINLVDNSVLQKAYPAHALPDITYDNSMQFFINGERIELLHFGPAHTTGDTAVIFRANNAVHLGDVYNNAGYPFIDADNGGSLQGVIAFCEAVLAAIYEDTTVIPGHGPVATYTDLRNYIYMLKTVRGEMSALIKDGKSLAEIQAAGITATWDEKLGDPGNFLNRSYVSLTQRYVP